MFVSKRTKWRIVAVLWAVFIATVCLRPSLSDEPDPYLIGVLKNFAHIPLFSILTYFILRSFKEFNLKIQAGSAALSVIYGILIEGLQMSVPGRYASLGDVIRDAIGAVIVIIVLRSKYGKNFLDKTETA